MALIHLTFFLVVISAVSNLCIHDRLRCQPALSDVNLREDNCTRVRRQKTPPSVLVSHPHCTSSYQPIRFHIHYDIGSILDETSQQKVRHAVESATLRMTSVLSVLPVKGTLLLSRSQACLVFKTGINKDMCFKLRKGYRGEICLDIFKLPYSHLKGVWLFNATFEKPLQNVIRQGPGVPHADMILYVLARSTKQCQSRSVIAFSSHCQLDNTTGRPLAGLINFCPFAVQHSSSSKQVLYGTALHEVLHVLGFSARLMHKMTTACLGERCAFPPYPYLHADGILRLGTEKVIQKSRQHFDCYTEPDFGGPLEEADGKWTSHWHPRLMYSSVMTGTGNNSSYSVLDPITLAFLEDTRWYKVNYSNADDFQWGRGEGCSFGVSPESHIDRFFCSGRSTGCDLPLLGKAECKSIGDDGRGVLVPINGATCATKLTGKFDGDMSEVFSPNSRCFLSTLHLSAVNGTTSSRTLMFAGKCYERMCSPNNVVHIRTDGTSWLSCPPGETVKVRGYHGAVLCPSDPGILCTGSDVKLQMATQSAGLSNKVTTTRSDSRKVTIPQNRSSEVTAMKSNSSDAPNLPLPNIIVQQTLGMSASFRRPYPFFLASVWIAGSHTVWTMA